MRNAHTMTEEEYQNTVVRLSQYPRKTLERWFAVNNEMTRQYEEQYAKNQTALLEKRLFSQIVQREIYTDAMCRKIWKDMRETFFGVRITELRNQYGVING